MADIITFSTKPRSRHARRTYQVHRFAQGGGVLRSCIITARDDSDAKRQAARLIDGHRTELWASNRFVAVFGAVGPPRATGFQAADQSTTGP